MADAINYNKKTEKFSFYSRKDVPWHRLGQYITPARDAEEALRMAQLDYKVKLGDMFVSFIPDGCKAVPFVGSPGFHVVNSTGTIIGNIAKKGEKINGLKAIYRDDTKEVFGTVSDRYEVVQNFESLDIIYNTIKGPSVTDRNQILIETAGALRMGETIFVTAKLPSYMIKVGTKEDIVDKYFVFTTSHNKSAQLTCLITDVRVVCNNTLNMALKTPNKVSLRHTKNVRDKFNLFGELLGISNKYSAEAKETLEHIAKSNVNSEQIKNYIYDMVVPTSQRELVRTVANINFLPDELISARLKNKVNNAMNYVTQGPGQDVAEGTAYWLYNGFTSFIHNGVEHKSAEERFTSLIGGSDELLVRKAYDKILEYV